MESAMSPDFASLYTDHIAAMRRLADQALAANGFDHLLIHSGALNYAFLDDNAYPFKVNPHFKRWVPVTDNPECLRSEEHTSELQSRENLVCRLLLEKKNKQSC